MKKQLIIGMLLMVVSFNALANEREERKNSLSSRTKEFLATTRRFVASGLITAVPPAAVAALVKYTTGSTKAASIGALVTNGAMFLPMATLVVLAEALIGVKAGSLAGFLLGSTAVLCTGLAGIFSKTVAVGLTLATPVALCVLPMVMRLASECTNGMLSLGLDAALS